jgi:hypothetical protein
MRRVWTFFYGSFMSSEVLAEAGVRPSDPQIARLDGWRLEIAPRATLVPAERDAVYGILARLTHADIDKLYTNDWFGFGAYLPEAVSVADAAGRPLPALCYVAWQAAGGKPTKEYLAKMVAVARAYSFPADYVRHIESFG